MIEKIKAYVKSHQMLVQSDMVIAGVSGGADSVCLFFVLLELEKEIGFRMAVVHVHHGLRGGDADTDEAFVRGLCETFTVPYRPYYYDVASEAGKRKQSIEEAGREVRREAFADAAGVLGGTKIALAHHQDDNAETMLLNLARGTRLTGAGGIRPVAGQVVRPLLCLRRKEIEDWLLRRNIAWRTDQSNYEDHYARNRIRRHVIPYLENEINTAAVIHMNETAAYLQNVQEYLDDSAREAMKTAVVKRADCCGTEYVLREKELNGLAEVIRTRVIYLCLLEAAGQSRDLGEIHVRMTAELLKKQSGKEADLPYGLKAVRCYEGVRIQQAVRVPSGSAVKKMEENGPGGVYSLVPGAKIHAGEISVEAKLLENRASDRRKPPENIYTKWFDYDIIKDTVMVRTRRPGDYLTIDDSGSRQKLKAFFINEKIPQEKRDQIWLVAAGQQILWVIGYRMGHTARITDRTKTILEITIDGGEEDVRNS